MNIAVYLATATQREKNPGHKSAAPVGVALHLQMVVRVAMHSKSQFTLSSLIKEDWVSPEEVGQCILKLSIH